MSTSTSQRQATPLDAPSTPRWALSAAGVSLVVLLGALVLGGGGTATSAPGLPDPGVLTRWGLPVATLVMQGAGTVTVGLLLLAVLLPAVKGELGREARRTLRLASIAAGVWTAAAVATHLLTLSDLSSTPLPRALQGAAFMSFTTTVSQGQALAVVVLLAATVAIASRLVLGYGGALALLLLGVVTLTPPTLTGHSASGQYHHAAAESLLVHVVAVVIWVGGLVALCWYAGSGGRQLGRVSTAYSTVALWCFTAVIASGVLNAYVRLTSPLDLFTTAYGGLLLGKVAAAAALFWFGLRHRRLTLPAVAAGRAGAFRRLAAGEIAVMAAAIGLGVALSRTPTPVPTTPESLTRASQLLGFNPPPAPTFGRILTEVYPDPIFALGCLAAIVLYTAGVVRLRRRGDAWPLGRTVSWMAGIVVVAFCTLSGLATYGMTMVSFHMGQHMTLMLLAPMLLVLGGPGTLALRALQPAPRSQRGPREWLNALLQSRVLRVVSHPLTVLFLFISSSFVVYFSPLFEIAMRHHTLHAFLYLHFVLVGYLFAEVLVGIDPLPSRPPFPLRFILLLLAGGFHAFFGIAFMDSATLIAGNWYRELSDGISWLPDAVADQRLAGGIAWGSGEIPVLLMIIVMFVQWYRSDERESRRKERSGADVQELAAYNSYLSGLERRE